MGGGGARKRETETEAQAKREGERQRHRQMDREEEIIIIMIVIIIIIIIIALKGAIRALLQSLHCAANCLQTHTLCWPGRNRVQITCSTWSAYHVPHVVCHVVRRDSSAIRFDTVEIAFILPFFYWLNH